MSEEVQMMRAIAMSLGENVQLSSKEEVSYRSYICVQFLKSVPILAAET